MKGDYNQEIRPKNKEEYEENDDLIILEDDKKDDNIYYLGEIEFRRIVLNKNYRNTIQITNGINRLIRQLEKYKKDFKFKEKKNNKNLLLGIATRNGEEPEYIYAMDTNILKEKIKEKIHYLINEKGIEQEEIILLYPPNFTDNEESKIYNNKTCGKLSKSIISKIWWI